MTRIRLMAACSACIVVALTGGAASAQDASAQNASDQHSHGMAGAAHSPFGAWGFDLAGRDTSVKPGDDFNEYANGTYLRTTEIPADKSRFGPFDVLYENAQSQLKSIIERVERLEVEKAEIMEQIKEVYLEAKGNGFDDKVLKKVVRLRKTDRAKRQEEDAILDLYLAAIGEI